ncbi:MAG: DNA cytosine methyltransferase [Muribaculaceae bacterium]
MIRLATVFSGIGSVEQALIRLAIPHDIVFACDNGEIELPPSIDEEDIKRIIYSLKSPSEKKQYIDSLYHKFTRQNHFVKQTYCANYNIDENNYHLDIRFLDGRDYYNKVDLIVGGSPCQSFSTVGAQHGLEDARGTLFYDFARIVKEVQPKVFIFENVRGLTTHDNGRTWKKIKEIFTSDLRYFISEPQVLNASDFGIPQTRRRLFVVGFKEPEFCQRFEYPNPIPLEYSMQDFLEDNCAYGCFTYNALDGKLYIIKTKGTPDPKFTLTDKVRDYVLSSGTKNFKTSVKTDLPIARTILKTMTQHHRAGVDNYITISENPKILRSLSDREALRLMGYPDNFKIVVSSRQIFRQAGNSIVVDVMMNIINSILKTKALS